MRRHDFTIKLADVKRSGLPPIFLRGSDKGAVEFVASSVCVTETRLSCGLSWVGGRVVVAG
jgi:hypothetical protein